MKLKKQVHPSEVSVGRGENKPLFEHFRDAVQLDGESFFLTLNNLKAIVGMQPGSKG